MQFEHLIRISPEQGTLAPALTRQQLWQGLVLRAQAPMRFDENISSARILAQSATTLQREVMFGSLQVIEDIELEFELAVRYRVQPSPQHAGGAREMRIEEPQPGVLFIRFVHHLPDQVDAETSEAELARLLPYVKSAYQQADMDTAKRIIELVATGQLTVQ